MVLDKPEALARLRGQAEDRLTEEQIELGDYSQRDLAQLVHELRVHQVELELQNQALRVSQTALQTAQEEYARLYDEAPIGYFGIDADGRIVHVNRTGADLLNAPVAGLTGKRFNRYVTTESQEDLHRFVVRLERARAKETIVLTMQRVGGDTFLARVEGVAEEPRIGGWRAMVGDVTRERHAEEALAESEARYRQLVQHAPAGIYEVAVPSGRLLVVNQVMTEITGYSQEELLSMTGFELTDEAGRALFADRLQRMARGEPVPGEAEYKVITKDGHEIWSTLHTRLIFDDGKPSRVFVVAHDITERKSAEEDLRLIMEGTAPLTGRDFLRALVRHLSHLLDARYVLVGRLEKGQSGSDAPGVVHTDSVWADGDWADNFSFDLRHSACAPVIAGQASASLTGVRELYPADPLLARWPVDSYRALPLRDARHATQGVLIVMDDSSMNQSPRTDPILAIFADRAAAELTRQASEASLRRYADQQAALYAVASTLTTTLDPVEMLDRVLAAVVPLFGADAAWVTVVGGTRDDPPSVLASQGIESGSVDPSLLAGHLDTCPACTAYRESAGHAALRVVYGCAHIPSSVAEAARLRSHACLPLAAHGNVLGSLTLGWRSDHEPERIEERLLLAVGYQLALGLYNAYLYQRTRQIDRLYVLAELNDALVATLDPSHAGQIALHAIASASGATQGVLLPYIDSLGHYPGSVLSLGGERIDVDTALKYHGWRPMLDRLYEQHLQPPPPSGQPLRLSDAATAGTARTVSRTVDEAGEEFLVVPIDDPDQPLADLVLSGRSFTDDDMTMAWAAAGRIAQAIRNAELYEQVRRLLQEREETEAQLVHSEKMAALGRLTASVSHEINNPVQAVLGCLGLAIEELDEAADRETVDRYLSIAMQELRRIAAIVRRMREFYRPAEHEWDVSDMNDTVSAVVELARNDLLGRDVQVELELAQVPPVPIRPDQIRQVFLNLILNAADAMLAGGTLTVRSYFDQARLSLRGLEPAVCVEFQDTGTGITPDVRARLFEPFFTTKREGSGLGLYISHGIVEAHGGEIEVDSRQGEGTTVRVWLPVGQAAESARS